LIPFSFSKVVYSSPHFLFLLVEGLKLSKSWTPIRLKERQFK
jgi:hypothetical protein